MVPKTPTGLKRGSHEDRHTGKNSNTSGDISVRQKRRKQIRQGKSDSTPRVSSDETTINEFQKFIDQGGCPAVLDEACRDSIRKEMVEVIKCLCRIIHEYIEDVPAALKKVKKYLKRYPLLPRFILQKAPFDNMSQDDLEPVLCELVQRRNQPTELVRDGDVSPSIPGTRQLSVESVGKEDNTETLRPPLTPQATQAAEVGTVQQATTAQLPQEQTPSVQHPAPENINPTHLMTDEHPLAVPLPTSTEKPPQADAMRPTLHPCPPQAPSYQPQTSVAQPVVNPQIGQPYSPFTLNSGQGFYPASLFAQPPLWPQQQALTGQNMQAAQFAALMAQQPLGAQLPLTQLFPQSQGQYGQTGHLFAQQMQQSVPQGLNLPQNDSMMGNESFKSWGIPEF